MRYFIFCQPLLLYAVGGNTLKHIAEQNKTPLGLMLYHQPLLYKDRIGMRRVKKIGRNKINPLLR